MIRTAVWSLGFISPGIEVSASQVGKNAITLTIDDHNTHAIVIVPLATIESFQSLINNLTDIKDEAWV